MTAVNLIRIFVINLKQSTERRDAISKKLEALGLKYDFFDAVDGRDLSDELVAEINSQPNGFKKTYGRDMLRGEIGAALSHMGIYQRIADFNYSYSLILEDDVDFDERLKFFLEDFSINSQLKNNFELILLGYCLDDLNYRRQANCSYWGRISAGPSLFVGVPVSWYWSAVGYIISTEGAMKLLDQGKLPRMPADFLTANCPRYGVKLGITSKPLIFPGELDHFSTIGERKYPDSPQRQPMSKKPPTGLRKIIKNKFQTYRSVLERFKLFQRKLSLRKYSFIDDRY